MSTKIYNGVQFDTTDLTLLLKRFKKMRVEAEAIQIKHLTKVISNITVRKLDSITTGRVPALDMSTRALFGKVKSEASDELYKSSKSKSNNYPFDVDFSVVVIPIGKKVLGMPFIRLDEHKKLWEAQPWIKEYGYWNNTDRLDGLTAADWQKRKKDWDSALPDSASRPSENGYHFDIADQLSPQLSIYEIKDIDWRVVDKKEARAKNEADLFVMDEYGRANKIDWVKDSSQVFRYLREAEGAAKVAAKTAEFLQLLPDKYDLDFKEPVKETP